ncbi:macro domain-containing protein [Enterococcus dongliensis]|uniref:macro domain-containing protein n=1 Tax=Enterococcus dongliensis TaxID=2559925 RepID=UPI00288FE981|nr:macro domain-containing protein [Enterococcus dongliensis]MDT2677404.1 macro domain-containing protein [Enterococcus dongliensis]
MIEIKLGDISQLAFQVDAIVNAANADLIPGGGVDGALNRAAGPELKEAMAKIGGTTVGSAVLTPAFDLPATYVIHAVGPRYIDGAHQEKDLLTAAYEAVFRLAHEYKLHSLALPVLSSGIYGYPKAAAAQILYEVATRPENQQFKTTVIVFEPEWLLIFEKLK